jgi:hypothetical protein
MLFSFNSTVAGTSADLGIAIFDEDDTHDSSACDLLSVDEAQSIRGGTVSDGSASSSEDIDVDAVVKNATASF